MYLDFIKSTVEKLDSQRYHIVPNIPKKIPKTELSVLNSLKSQNLKFHPLVILNTVQVSNNYMQLVATIFDSTTLEFVPL